ncbi:helix-turn-helix domain-containing protein [Streptomyces sp. Je 1-4]|uniref:helix-turn-helix domain-containing protein n=1 Tax=Streptomyces TaxID=1883 RepID=UPI0021DAC5D3|nr:MULTISPECIES: helix-turn-helix transcriptional regulator [unclassified Streptomyces]UYB40930.1 helix-turn-helix domain-containing protein [Streptomyces sp. Je 1-4]UZQ37090.1 helix-turn-helix domain-containing protein [Streptomyces sp. Je 1-4] [Streptomyces sp. Je 1-4 4N24]UZQ44507.1 helix-turn-helix domain-containing protein [Streptomyces sp. Je 1-4] [Streptomyces sp. Je 1-4 4N24_ara]
MLAQSPRGCEQCGCRLSQYNSGTLCSACVRSRTLNQHALSVPERVWRSQEIQQALASWDFGKATRLIRQQGSLRQDDIAHLTGLSQAFLSMLESGHRRLTNIDKIVEFLTGLGVPPELAPLPLPRPLRPSRDLYSGDLDPALPWTASRMVTALGTAVGGSAMDRRRFLAVSGLALTAFVHHWSTAEAEPLVRAAEGSRLTHKLLDSLQETTDNLRSMDASAGSGTLADLGNAHLLLLKRLVEQASYDEGTGQRLAAITADTAIQTGWFTFDSGDRDRSPTYLFAALRAAKASGDVRLGVGALSYLAIHGYSTGAPRNAVTAARAAREKIKHLGAPALEAMLLTRQARGHARLGERQEVFTALGQAADLCAQGRSERDPHWLYWINEGEIHGQAGSCYLDLGEPQKAVTSFTQAHDSLNPSDQRTRALFLSRAASAHVRQGDAEAGCDTAHRALDLAEQLQSARLNEHVESMLSDLEAVGDATYAQDLLDRGAAVTGARNRT